MDFLSGLLAGIAAGAASRAGASATLREASPAVPVPVVRTVDEVLVEWHAQRRRQYGYTQIDAAHVCSAFQCKMKGGIVIIDVALHLYGCIHYGKHHLCSRSEAGTCTETIVTTAADVICLYSGQVIGKSPNRTRYSSLQGQEEKSKQLDRDDYIIETDAARTAQRNSRAADVDIEIWSAGSYAMPSARRRRVAAKRVAEQTSNPTKKFGMMIMHPSGEKPQPGIIASGRAIEGVSSAVKPKVAPLLLTDAEQSSFSVVRMREEYIHDGTRRDIASIVGALFSRNYRSRLRAEREETADAKAKALIVHYFRRCRNASIRPCSMVTTMIFMNCRASSPVPTVGRESHLGKTRKEEYVDFIFKMWHLAISSKLFAASHTTFHLLEYVAGCIYLMADGIDAKNCISRPADPWLAAHLPPIALLSTWTVQMMDPFRTKTRYLSRTTIRKKYVRITKSDVAFGKKTVKEVLLEGSITRRGAPPDTMTLRHSRQLLLA